jgi:hypothetical protein
MPLGRVTKVFWNHFCNFSGAQKSFTVVFSLAAMMRKSVLVLLVGFVLGTTGGANGQTLVNVSVPTALTSSSADLTPISTSAPQLPLMAPDLALKTYQDKLARQASLLSGYSDETVIHAELVDTKQQGQYELRRSYTAPHTLSYQKVKFEGDGFVKTNVIGRILQSEVDLVQKGNSADMAITERNYKFNYKGRDIIDGHSVHVYQLKPRKKRPGLFKGRVYIDAQTGNILRAEGSLVKSPSFFVKKVEFVQDYTDVKGFTFPTYLRTIAKARIIGLAIVHVFHRGYEPQVASVVANTAPPTR